MMATADSHLAWMRTRFAIDRTFMAWLRTAASMIGFGFTIVEAFRRLDAMKSLTPPEVPQAPTVLGLLLIGSGTVALAIAFVQYNRVVRHLADPMFRPIADPRRHRAPAWIVAIALLAAGIVAFSAVLVRALF